MSISIREFKTTMETLAAERLTDQEGHGTSVPRFYFEGVEFVHSGSYYILSRGNRPSEEIMNCAMAEFGEKFPGGENFWWGEIHSIKAMLTLATMLRGNFSKGLVDELTNDVYKKILDCSLIKRTLESPFKSLYLPEMKALTDLIADYRSVVNPFGDGNLKFKEPADFLNAVGVGLSTTEKTENPYCRLDLTGSRVKTHFMEDKYGWAYQSEVPVQKDRRNGCIFISYYFSYGNNGCPSDEVVYMEYHPQRKMKALYSAHPDDIDLRISLKTGLAWRTYKEAESMLATDEQLKTMISHLNMSIKKIRERIVKIIRE